MQDRRASGRDGTTGEIALTEGFEGPVRHVKLIDASPSGVQIETDGTGIDGRELAIQLGPDQPVRRARIVWRRMARFGLAFDGPAPSVDVAPRPARRRTLALVGAGDAVKPWRPPSLSDVLLREIVKKAGQR